MKMMKTIRLIKNQKMIRQLDSKMNHWIIHKHRLINNHQMKISRDKI